MKLSYHGYSVTIDKKKWSSLSFAGKAEAIRSYLRSEFEYKKEKFHDYWVGYVSVYTNDIYVLDSNNTSGHDELYEVSILAGRKGDGQTFSGIGRELIQEIVEKWESSPKKRYHLHISLGGGAYQEYTFSRKQKEMLIAQLKPLLQKKWYSGNCQENKDE